MSSIKDLENILMDAYEQNLVDFVHAAPDYIKVVLRDTENAQETLLELTDYMKKNFPDVRYFHIDLIRLTFSVYHFDELKTAQRLADDECKP